MDGCFLHGLFIVPRVNGWKKMDKTDFKEYICRPWCMFFAEGEKEEMACLGARAAAWLVREDRVGSRDFESITKDRDLWEKHRPGLARTVCRQCAFCAADCDFHSPEPEADIEPCGGYIVLAYLLENNTIGLKDIEEAL